MAEFVVYLGFTPDQYWALTLAERDAIVRAQADRARHNRT